MCNDDSNLRAVRIGPMRSACQAKASGFPRGYCWSLYRWPHRNRDSWFLGVQSLREEADRAVNDGGFGCREGGWRLWDAEERKSTSHFSSSRELAVQGPNANKQQASTHTVASIASTVRTRASNVIQIAYIPGVTNRSGPSSPAYLVPPVPPLPYTDSPSVSQFPRSPNGDIQFAASDLLRGSMCTVDNRSSIATTIYGGNAIVSQPNIIRAGKAAVVTVKGGSGATSSSSSSIGGSPQVPPVPAVYLNGSSSHAKGTALETVPPSPAFSV